MMTANQCRTCSGFMLPDGWGSVPTCINCGRSAAPPRPPVALVKDAPLPVYGLRRPKL